ncbi:signal recognition particle protein [Bacillus stratosphericus LAMA 585]|nr:signal recognition particle protein [Bacillus stratosphericus LAMA 585]
MARRSINDHGTSATYFFQAVHVPVDRRCFFTFFIDRITSDFHECRNDVHIRTVRDFEFLIIRLAICCILTCDNKLNRIFFTHLISPPFSSSNLVYEVQLTIHRRPHSGMQVFGFSL